MNPDESDRPVLILSASMGGGHMQVAHEMRRRFEALGRRASVIDILELTPRWGPFVAWFYQWMVNRAPWLYDWVYRRFFLAPQSRAERASVPVRLAMPGLRRLVRETDPEVVVSTYHLAGVAAATLRSSGRLRAPAVTFVTTFGVHDLWIHPGTDLYLCITQQAAADLSARAPAAVVKVCEPVVRPVFAGLQDDPARRREPGSRVALVVSGALGMGPVSAAVRAASSVPGWSVVAVCGRNDSLRRRLSALPGVQALGWVEDMAGLMVSADVVIDNAGGSTAKEALAAGCPVVTYRPIPGHGRHDAEMMQQAGLTEVIDDEGALAAALERLGDPAVRRARAERGRALFGVDPVRLTQRWLGTPSAAPAA